MKLTDIIDLIVGENIAYRMALENDIVNYSALAKKIKKKVDNLSGKDVPLNTIVKLLTLYKKKNICATEPAKALNQVSISLDYGYSKKTISNNDFPNTNFLIAVKNGDKIDILIKEERDSEFALLKLKMKENFSEIPGITVLVISILEMFNIKVKYIYRIGHEIFILLNKKDAPKALEKLAFYSSIQNDID
ncbi:MAG: hypothetical protein ACP5R0_01125 [Thermoplasmata archaeon]